MPHTIKDGQQFPMECPACKQAAGTPFMAGTHLESGGISVGMRCTECGHEWRFEMAITTGTKRDSGVRRNRPDDR